MSGRRSGCWRRGRWPGRGGAGTQLVQPRQMTGSDRFALRRGLIGETRPDRPADRHIRGRPSPAPKRIALPVFASDAISSTANATDEILIVLLTQAGVGAAAWGKLVPLAVVVAVLLVIVVVSYRETIYAYPSGGGSYVVSRENLGETPSLVAGASLLTDYILAVAVAVSVAGGVLAIQSAFDFDGRYRVPLAQALIAGMRIANLRGLRSPDPLRPAHVSLHRHAHAADHGRLLPHLRARSGTDPPRRAATPRPAMAAAWPPSTASAASPPALLRPWWLSPSSPKGVDPRRAHPRARGRVPRHRPPLPARPGRRLGQCRLPSATPDPPRRRARRFGAPRRRRRRAVRPIAGARAAHRRVGRHRRRRGEAPRRRRENHDIPIPLHTISSPYAN